MTAFSRGKVADLLAACTPIPLPEAGEDSKITVHAAVSRVSVLYEKLRTAIDYKDDHLLRKAAVKRILKRRMTLESDARVIAGHLVRELIAARYLPNATLPESLIDEVALIVRKLTSLRQVRAKIAPSPEWLLGIVAAELEELLSDRGQAKAIVHFLFEQLGDRITVSEGSLQETERRLQVYIACHRLLYKADDEMLGYRLIRLYSSAWMRPQEWIAEPREMTSQMAEVETRIRLQLLHPLAQKFLMAVKPWAVALNVLRETLEEKPELKQKLSESSEELKAAVIKIAERRYQASKSRLRRGTWRSIIYLFLTKMVLALALEIPFERYLYQELHYGALTVNILFPPLLMWIVGLFIRVPGKDNTRRIGAAVEELLSVDGPKGREIRITSARRGLGGLLFSFSYVAMFLITFGLILLALQALHFTWVSAIIFVFFLCVVSFFAYRLRLGAREYVVMKEKESFRMVVVDFFTLPILRAGQYLSMTVSRLNIFIFLFDFIIEAPFKTFLNVLEEWFSYLKEKKEELQ